MTLRNRLAFVCLGSAVGLVAGCGDGRREAAPPAPAAESPVAVTEQWRAKHETDYRRDWVTIAGLYPLEAGATTTAGSAGTQRHRPAARRCRQHSGRFVLHGDRAVRFEPAPGVTVRLSREKDQPVTAPVELRDDSAPGADELVVGDVRLVVHVSGERESLRVRDPNGALAKGFLGFTWFPIDPQYRVVGRFIPDRAAAADQGAQHVRRRSTTTRREGVVEFTLHGQTLRLRPFTTRPKRFYFVFKDESSGTRPTKPRASSTPILLDDGTTVLDFNQAYNPPCAFNPYTTCPIPLRENRLPIKVLAGEKAYPVHVPFGTEKKQ